MPWVLLRELVTSGFFGLPQTEDSTQGFGLPQTIGFFGLPQTECMQPWSPKAGAITCTPVASHWWRKRNCCSKAFGTTEFCTRTVSWKTLLGIWSPDIHLQLATFFGKLSSFRHCFSTQTSILSTLFATQTCSSWSAEGRPAAVGSCPPRLNKRASAQGYPRSGSPRPGPGGSRLPVHRRLTEEVNLAEEEDGTGIINEFSCTSGSSQPRHGRRDLQHCRPGGTHWHGSQDQTPADVSPSAANRPLAQGTWHHCIPARPHRSSYMGGWDNPCHPHTAPGWQSACHLVRKHSSAELGTSVHCTSTSHCPRVSGLPRTMKGQAAQAKVGDSHGTWRALAGSRAIGTGIHTGVGNGHGTQFSCRHS